MKTLLFILIAIVLIAISLAIYGFKEYTEKGKFNLPNLLTFCIILFASFYLLFQIGRVLL